MQNRVYFSRNNWNYFRNSAKKDLFSPLMPVSSSLPFNSRNSAFNLSFIISIMPFALPKSSWCPLSWISPNFFSKVCKIWDFKWKSRSAAIRFTSNMPIWYAPSFYSGYMSILTFLLLLLLFSESFFIFRCSFDLSGIDNFSYFFMKWSSPLEFFILIVFWSEHGIHNTFVKKLALRGDRPKYSVHNRCHFGQNT